MGKSKISVDYSKCGDGAGVDPRDYGKCLRVCDPAVFLCNEALGVKQDPIDPQIWRITPMWLNLCNHCVKCVEVCPQRAITVS
ncbi:hypothetical protein MUP59_04470 [Candidatus Bathyarchaeota archaeon]|nr:hypothetical protein [Candidatus Bathyarchaeota archaeon]